MSPSPGCRCCRSITGWPPSILIRVPVEDCFAALLWLHDLAADFGLDRARIGVMGDSAGGGLAAGTAILARHRALPLALQILVYPMLDDRNVVPDPELVPFALWSYDANMTGWAALLGDQRGRDDVPPSAAPARETDFAGLAPAYIEVGELDIFRAEDVRYALASWPRVRRAARAPRRAAWLRRGRGRHQRRPQVARGPDPGYSVALASTARAHR